MSTKHLVAVVALACVLPYGCAGRQAVWSEDSSEPAPNQQATGQQTSTTAGDEVAKLVAEGNTHWDQRTSAEEIRAAITAWEKALEQQPGDLDVLTKLTRAHYFLADAYLRDSEKEYLATMDKGVKWGERAMVAASPEFEKMMRDGAKLPEAVKVMPKAGVPAMYWYASALGKWAKKKGFAVLLGQKDNVKATMDRALELDPNYYYGGPHRYFGAYYAIAPAFAGGDLEKSKVHFKKSLEIEPNYVGTKVLWAQELAVKTQDEELFDKLLAEVLETPDDVIPEVRPEIMIEKIKAKELIAQKDDLF